MEANVLLGANWLDENIPDWYKHIDCKTLDIRTWTNCVLGQLEYRNNKSFFSIINKVAGNKFGLDLHAFAIAITSKDADFDELKSLWIKQIEQRKGNENAGITGRTDSGDEGQRCETLQTDEARSSLLVHVSGMEESKSVDRTKDMQASEEASGRREGTTSYGGPGNLNPI